MARSFITPLARARGSGSAHEGTGHFIAQRATAIASLILTLFLAVLAVLLAGRDYAAARVLIANPFIAAGLLATAATFCWHMKLGMQVIIEDYVHGPVLRPALLLANVVFCVAVFLLAAVAIGKIAFGA
jgi:succinate dehydrogenase / fumarate reductase membrane anchor subunit